MQSSLKTHLVFCAVNFYVNLGETFLWRFGLRCHQYEDDSQLCLSFPSDPREAVEVLNQYLKSVMNWMWVNRLKLNPDKTEVLLDRDPINLGLGINLFWMWLHFS